MPSFFCDLDDGTRLECRTSGEISGAPVVLVFLHEGLGCLDLWRDFPEALSRATGLPALWYSRAGYGRSSGIEWPRPVTYMHHEALAVLPNLLDELGISDVILFGHSNGASISLIYAGCGHADRVRGIIVESPHVFIENVTVESIRDLVDQYEHGNLRSRLARYQGENVDCAFRGFAETWLVPENASWNILDYVRRIQVPTLAIQGRDDRYGTLKQIEAIQDAAPGFVESDIIDQCGHHPHFEATSLVLSRSTEFIRKVLEREDSG